MSMFHFLHTILNNKVPVSVCETFAIMLHSHITRSNNKIIIPQINTNCFGTYSIKWNHFSNILQLLFFSSIKKLVTSHI